MTANYVPIIFFILYKILGTIFIFAWLDDILMWFILHYLSNVVPILLLVEDYLIFRDGDYDFLFIVLYTI